MSKHRGQRELIYFGKLPTNITKSPNFQRRRPRRAFKLRPSLLLSLLLPLPFLHLLLKAPFTLELTRKPLGNLMHSGHLKCDSALTNTEWASAEHSLPRE